MCSSVGGDFLNSFHYPCTLINWAVLSQRRGVDLGAIVENGGGEGGGDRWTDAGQATSTRWAGSRRRADRISEAGAEYEGECMADVGYVVRRRADHGITEEEADPCVRIRRKEAKQRMKK